MLVWVVAIRVRILAFQQARDCCVREGGGSRLGRSAPSVRGVRKGKERKEHENNLK